MNIERAREILGKKYDCISDEKLQETIILMTAICSRLVDQVIEKQKNDSLESSLEDN